MFAEESVFDTVKIALMIIYHCVLLLTMIEVKCSKSTRNKLAAACILYCIAVAWLFLVRWNLLTLARVGVLIICVPVFVLLFFLSKDNGMKSVFLFATQLVFCIVISVTVTTLRIKLNINHTGDLAIRSALYIAAIIVEARFLRKPYRFLADNLKIGWVPFAMVPIFFSVLMIITLAFPAYYTENILGMVMVYVEGAIMLAVYVVMFQSLKKSIKIAEVTQKNDLLNVQMSSLENQMKAVREAQQSIEIYKHDTRHLINSLTMLLEKNDVEAALIFLGKLRVFDDKVKVERFCKNDVINSIIAYYIEEMRKEKIEVKYRLDVQQLLPVEDMELATVLANLLENARTACKKLETEKRRVEIICMSEPSFVLEVSNTYTGDLIVDANGMPRASLPGRGIGIKSIQSFAEKHNALIDYKIEPGIFRFRLLIPAQ